MKKKLMNVILLLIFLVSLVSFSVNAAPRFIEAGLRPIEDFFSGGWQNYQKTIVFLVFFFLFYSAFLIGVKKAFQGELTRSHIVFAFVAAFLSSMIISTTMDFDWINLEYVAWGLIATLILFLIHSLLLKLGMKNKFWAFILALVIAALLGGLIWYLVNDGRPLSGMGRMSNWFGDLSYGDGDGGGGGGSDLWPGGVAPGEVDSGEGGATTGGVGGGKRNWVLIFVIIAVLLGGGGLFAVSKIKHKRKTPDVAREEVEIHEKREAIDKIKDVVHKKNKILRDMHVIAEKDPPNGIKGVVPDAHDSKHDSAWLVPPKKWVGHAWNTIRKKKVYETVWALWNNYHEFTAQNDKLVKILNGVKEIEGRVLKDCAEFEVFSDTPEGRKFINVSGLINELNGLKTVCNKVLGIIDKTQSFIVNENNLIGSENNILDEKNETMLEQRKSDGWCQQRIGKIKELIQQYYVSNSGNRMPHQNCELHWLRLLNSKMAEQVKILEKIKEYEPPEEVPPEEAPPEKTYPKQPEVNLSEREKARGNRAKKRQRDSMDKFKDEYLERLRYLKKQVKALNKIKKRVSRKNKDEFTRLFKNLKSNVGEISRLIEKKKVREAIAPMDASQSLIHDLNSLSKGTAQMQIPKGGKGKKMRPYKRMHAGARVPLEDRL